MQDEVDELARSVREELATPLGPLERFELANIIELKQEYAATFYYHFMVPLRQQPDPRRVHFHGAADLSRPGRCYVAAVTHAQQPTTKLITEEARELPETPEALERRDRKRAADRERRRRQRKKEREPPEAE